jgi:hypothetical protein
VDDPREPATVDLGSNDNLELFPDPLDVLSRPRIRERTTRLAPRPIRSPTRAEPEKLSDTGFQFPPPPTPRNRPRPNATATPVVAWLQTLHHASNGSHPHPPSPKTNRKALPEHIARIGTGRRRGKGDQPKPHPDTDIANEPAGLVGSQFIRIVAT